MWVCKHLCSGNLTEALGGLKAGGSVRPGRRYYRRSPHSRLPACHGDRSHRDTGSCSGRTAGTRWERRGASRDGPLPGRYCYTFRSNRRRGWMLHPGQRRHGYRSSGPGIRPFLH